MPRIGFVNDEGSEMIQVQNDRFIKNWREVETDRQTACRFAARRQNVR